MAHHHHNERWHFLVDERECGMNGGAIDPLISMQMHATSPSNWKPTSHNLYIDVCIGPTLFVNDHHTFYIRYVRRTLRTCVHNVI